MLASGDMSAREVAKQVGCAAPIANRHSGLRGHLLDPRSTLYGICRTKSRKRGEFCYCRGAVRAGGRIFEVREFSTGCSDKADAEAVGASDEQDRVHQHRQLRRTVQDRHHQELHRRL
jgi:hypothetical protein